jgi:hypothetical protein
MGAAHEGGDVLQVDVGAWIYEFTSTSERSDSGGIRPAKLFLAVKSLARGVVEQLQSGNVRLYDALRGPRGEYTDPGGPETVEIISFRNMGGGFYQVDVAPYYHWWPDQYVLRVEIECPWGRGITVCELPLGAADRR